MVPTLLPFTFHWYDGEAPPLVGVAVNVTVLPLHIVVCVALILKDGVTSGFTVMVMLLDVAVVGDAQLALEVSTQVIISPLTKAVVVYPALVAPVMLAPFFFHWYAGALPPLVGVAVNVTLVTAHIVVLLALMLTDGTIVGLTKTDTLLDVAVVGDAHATLLVSTQVNTSELSNVEVVYVALVAPLMLLPFFFHW